MEVGAPFSSNQAPGAISRATLDPNGGRLAYITEVGVGLLTWGASGAPVAGAVFDPKVAPTFLAFSADGTRLLVGDGVNGVIAVCDPASGKVVGAQDAPSLVSLARIPDGPNQGFFVAGANGGSALVLPSGQILLTSFIGVDMRGIAVDAACGNVLVASAFGPLQIPAGTLAAQALDGSLALDGVQTSGGGVVGWSGADLYAFVPPANCLGKGSFKLVASASQSVLQAALSANGKWVASSDGVKLELIPRTDNGAGLQKQSIDFDSPAFTPVRYAGDSLTVGHPVAGGGFAVSTYAKGTLQETAALTLQGDPTHLDRVRFAQAWIIDVPQFQDFVQVATLVTIWDEKQGVLATASVPYAFTEPAGLSADGFMLAGISTTNSGIDTLLLQVLGTRLVQEPGPHVDLPSTPQQVLPSPDGSRLYISMPNAGAVAVIE